MKIKKKIAFSMAPLLALALLAEGGLWLVGVEPPLHASDPYVGFSNEVSLFETRQEGSVEWRRTAPNKRDFFNDQQFRATKDPNSRRIFCLGGSTTYGRPYRDVTSFCAWLRMSLELVEPQINWEVVNAGGISYASYRVAALMQELAGEQPDLFIVYSGHNEFLEERTYGSLRERPAWLRALELSLWRTRIYGVVRWLVSSLDMRVQEAGSDTSGRVRLSGEVETRLESSIGLAAYHRDDELTKAVIEHYRLNLERMIHIARAASSELVLVVPADNLADCAPFKSELSRRFSATEMDAFDDRMERAEDALYRGDLQSARELFAAAVEMDPRYAHAQYGLGRALRAFGRTEDAREALVRSRDEDVCPLRALSPIVETVRVVADREGVALVDFPALIADATGEADSTPPGEDWFLDHVHPTIDGHRLLARHLLGEVYRLGWLAEDPEMRRSEIAAMEADRLAGLDPLEHGLALRNLAKVLSWAGKNEDAARAARRALTALGDDEESYFVLAEFASSRDDSGAAIAYLREALRVDPTWVKARNNLGVELMRVGRFEDALACYDEVLELAPDHPSARFNRANALRRLGRIDEAVEDYGSALRQDPRDVDALFNLARIHEDRGRPDLALEQLRLLLEIDPDDEEADFEANRLAREVPSS